MVDPEPEKKIESVEDLKELLKDTGKPDIPVFEVNLPKIPHAAADKDRERIAVRENRASNKKEKSKNDRDT